MTPRLRLSAAVGVVFGMVAADAALATGTAHAQKPRGVLKMSHFDSSASMSLHEEATAAVNRPMTLMVNSIYNGSRYEDIWLDR